mgnify:CR=1 FL=1
MANLRLKKLILQVVDNQINDSSIPFVREAYEKIQSKGYSKSEAREMIATAVVEDIYIIMKENKKFDKREYAEKIERLVENCKKKK